jgi:hypothetical protein
MIIWGSTHPKCKICILARNYGHQRFSTNLAGPLCPEQIDFSIAVKMSGKLRLVHCIEIGLRETDGILKQLVNITKLLFVTDVCFCRHQIINIKERLEGLGETVIKML